MSTRGRSPAASLGQALVEGLAPDGGLYMPESIECWAAEDIAGLPSRSLVEIGMATLRPFTRDTFGEATLNTVVAGALTFPIPIVEVEPGIYALELFHGPTLAFKDVGARVMARLMAALHDGGDPLTILVATSGDTGGAVAHAFHDVPHMRVIVLYPDGGVSPTQEAQLTMFNAIAGATVRAFAVAGTFDECQRLVKAAFADCAWRERARLTSANSINIGRLLPQSIYYFQGVARLPPGPPPIVSTPSGNFGNLTAGLMAKRAGLPIAQFVAATNVNDVVPMYLQSGRFEPRPSIPTIANAMDVGNPSNFDRMLWLYGGDVGRMRRDVAGSRHDDEEVRATIRRVYDERGHLLDPHSAIAYLGVKERLRQNAPETRAGMFLATAHPAKFPEVIDPIIGRAVAHRSLEHALASGRRVLRIDATLDAVKEAAGV